MDIAYDHIHEESLPAHHDRDASAGASSSSTTQQPSQTLNTEFQQAFQAVSSSPWGARLGGWFGEARKQSQTFYSELQKEASEAQQQATKGLEGLRGQLSKGLDLNAIPRDASGVVPGEESVPVAPRDAAKETSSTSTSDPTRPESLTADIVAEATSLVSSLRQTALLQLADLSRAEEAADEALLKFGTNVRDFLKDAVVISAPTAADANKPKGLDAQGNEVLFETTEQGTGRKVFHTTRLDAQLHAVHSTAASFTQDPVGGEQWDSWDQEFDAEKQTDAIARDLETYGDLRRAMEKLVPEKVEYSLFWKRYYFIRKAIGEEETKRKEVLKGMSFSPFPQSQPLNPTNTSQTPQQTTKKTSPGTTKTPTPKPLRPPLPHPNNLRRPPAPQP
jgi:hypothetical protein